MSNYRKIADEFARIGHRDTAHLNQYQINNALDKIIQNNINLAEFNRQVALQLFEQTDKDSSNNVLLRDYINTILSAHSVLQKHIAQCKNKLALAQDQETKAEILQNIHQFQQDYHLLTAPFRIEGLQSSRLPESAVSRSGLNRSKDKSSIFADEPSNREESGSLKIALAIALASFLFQLICMFVKHHFLNLLAYLAVLSIFFLNHFDKYTIRVALAAVSTAVFLDLVWLIAESDAYWETNGQTQHSTLQAGFLRFVYLISVILMISKVVIAILLFRFRHNNNQIKKSVRLFNLRFDLDGSVQLSPFISFFQPKSNRNSNNIYY